MVRKLNVTIVYGSLAVVSIIATVWLKMAPPSGAIPAAITYGLIIAFLLALTSFTWRSMDEAARDAHKSAWFWGGGLGVAVAGWAASVIMAPGVDFSALMPAVNAPQGYFGLGVLATMLLQLIGFVIVWAGWWLSKR